MGIQVASKEATKIVRTLDAGQAFGELALLKTDGRRAASVVTTMASEFLSIDGRQYQQLLGQLQREELREKVDVLRRCTHVQVNSLAHNLPVAREVVTVIHALGLRAEMGIEAG